MTRLPLPMMVCRILCCGLNLTTSGMRHGLRPGNAVRNAEVRMPLQKNNKQSG
jgi:hypothetical protein